MSAAAARHPPGPPGGPPPGLPRLRRDLDIEVVPERGGGFPSVIVTDPVRGSYFRLSWPESGVLLMWQQSDSIDALRSSLASTYGIETSPQEISAVVEFAVSSQLTVAETSEAWQRHAKLHAASKHGLFMSLIHGYLFFRVPLVHPEAALIALLPRLSFVYTRRFWWFILAVALVGLYLATRQWTALTAAVAEVLRLEGLLIYALAILGLKAIHELGHALTTVRYGCRVPSMGLAVMLGAPVLYTDTSDSWRLARRSERLAIVFAGVAAEFIVAVFAILVWAFLPDGLPRQICFALATSSVALSLAVNLNPFMRFDGYFALSDYLEIPNLQARSFKLALWNLRKLLFDLGHPPPEQLPPRMRRTLIVYACLTAIYRLFLFLGIAAVVYVMAGKAIGIPLALFEIGVFIAMPIGREIATWWSLRAEIIARRRALWTAGIVAGTTAFLFLPVSLTVEVPAVLVARSEEPIHLPFPAHLVDIAVVEGQVVEAGDVLFSAGSRDLEQQRAKAALEMRALEVQVSRLHAGEKEREGRVVTESKLARAREQLQAIDRQLGQLVVRAPFNGRVVDLAPEVTTGIWLNQKLQLARVVSIDGGRVKGLISDAEIPRVSNTARAVFIADDAAAARYPVTVTAIAPASDGRLAEPILADRHGGSVASGDDQGELHTRQGWFEVTFQSDAAPPQQVMRGVAVVDATSTSLAMLLWRRIGQVLVREHVF